ncbi:MAG: pseudouridylate synthase [Gammaproteobacteria bacterium]|nr:pseudouridylate synthase [Gammaproteobacteria bacterium]
MDILYQDEHLAAFYKPAGLLVHRSAVDRGARRYALQTARDALGRRVYPLHRLDKPTAGLLLFALDAETARRMTVAFTLGAVRKRYLAVVRGHTERGGVIEHRLAEERDPTTDARARSGARVQSALTGYTRLATCELPIAVGRYPTARYSLLAVTPCSGRRHQIRRHLKHVFHPVIGDTSHGDGRHNRMFRERFDCRRLLLVAIGLGFAHPYSGAPVAIATPPDAGFQATLRALGWHLAVPDTAIGAGGRAHLRRIPPTAP